MRLALQLATLALFFSHCTPTPQGADGPSGPQGAEGPTGERGPSGICDESSCPAIATLDGLSGGHVAGTTTLETAVVEHSLTANRIVTKRGTKQTSVVGAYCGFTSFTVDGTGFRTGATGGSEDRFGPWAIKRWCEETCGAPTAHACSVQEIYAAQDLRGGSDRTSADSNEPDNPAVPFPPLNPIPGDTKFQMGWVRSLDGVSSCKGFRSSTGTGVVFVPDNDPGSFDTANCNDQHPIYCCD